MLLSKTVSFENSLGLRVIETLDDGVMCECAIHENLMNGQGVLHGGITATIADEAAWWAIETHTGDGKRSTTTELKVNYLLPITGERVTARAFLLRTGKTLCVSRVDIHRADGQLAAVAIVTYMFLPQASSV